MTDAAPISTFDIHIHPDDIDEFDHVNNAVHLRWVQKVVVAHWRELGTTEWFRSHLWVALRHEILYHHAIYRDDPIVAQVKVTSIRGVRATFSTLFVRGETVIARVESDWCCLDSGSRKPKRVGKEIVQTFLGK